MSNTFNMADRMTGFWQFPPMNSSVTSPMASPASVAQTALDTLADAAVERREERPPATESSTGGRTFCPNPMTCTEPACHGQGTPVSVPVHEPMASSQPVQSGLPLRPIAESIPPMVPAMPRAIPSWTQAPDWLNATQFGLTGDNNGMNDNDDDYVEAESHDNLTQQSVTPPAQICVPRGQPITGLGFITTGRDGWECQYKVQGAALSCGAICETARDLVAHYSTAHAAVNALLPDYWHPCHECLAFNRDYAICQRCGLPATYAKARWIFGFVTGDQPEGPGHVVVGLNPLPSSGENRGEHGSGGDGGDEDDDDLFATVSAEERVRFGFDGLIHGTLHPVFHAGANGGFSRQFYSALSLGLPMPREK